MHRTPTSWRAVLGVIAACSGASGCLERILATSPSIDLNACYGTDCDQVDTDPTEPTWSDAACDRGEPLSLESVWMKSSSEPVACDSLGECEVSDFHIAPSADGNLWVAASASTNAAESDVHDGGLWLARHDSNGERFGSTLIDIERGVADLDYSFSITSDAADHLFVAVLKRVTTHVESESAQWSDVTSVSEWLAEYSPDLELVGKRILVDSEIGGRLVIQTAGSQALALAGSGGDGQRLALFDTVTRSLRWVQTRSRGSEVGSMVSDGMGRVSLFARPPESALDDHDGVIDGRTPTIEHYDESGRLLWHLIEDIPNSASSSYGFAIGPARELIQLRYHSDPEVDQLRLMKLDADSTTGTRTHVETFLGRSGETSEWEDSSGTAVASDGSVFHAGGIYDHWQDDPAAQRGVERSAVLYQFAPNADACRLYRREGAGSSKWTALAVGTGDELYFASSVEYGRFQYQR